MPTRTRIAAATVIAMLAVVGAGASARSAPGRISAHLTSTSFAAARASAVKVNYRFSSRSTRFGYVLSLKQGARWSAIVRVSRRGSFSGSHTMTVKRVFGTKPINAGRYRLELSSDANSVTLTFSVKPLQAVVPRPGSWVSTGVSGPFTGSGGAGPITVTGIGFGIARSRPSDVSSFDFAYQYDGGAPAYACAGSTVSEMTAPLLPITNGQFSSPASPGSWTTMSSLTAAGTGTFHGTFDTPTTAHGTAQFTWTLSDSNCSNNGTSATGTFSWTAKLARPLRAAAHDAPAP